MKSNIKKAVIIAILTALFVVLSIYGTINIYGIKLTIQNLPLLIGAILFGAGPGAFIGFAGMMLNQMLTYGFTATTLLWVLPHTVVGAVVGFVFEKGIVTSYKGHKFWVVIIFSQLVLTVLNTIVIYIDSVIFGYYSFFLVFGTFIIRIMVTVLVSIVYCCILPYVLLIAKKIH